MVYEDFADELFKFMRTLGDAVRAGNAETVLLDGFHDEGLQSSIITHLRVSQSGITWTILTSSRHSLLPG